MSTEFRCDDFLSHSAKDTAVVRSLAERSWGDGLANQGILPLLGEEKISAGMRVIPFFLPGAKNKDVPLFARQLERIDLRSADDAKRRQQMRKLVKAVLIATADP